MSARSLFILFVLVVQQNSLLAQNHYTLKIYGVQGEINQDSFSATDTITDFLVKDQVKEILIYRQGELSYLTSFEFKHSGNRLKLSTRNYVVEKGRDPVFGKWKKRVQFLKVGTPGHFSQSGGEYLLLDKENLKSIRANYRLTMTYLQ